MKRKALIIWGAVITGLLGANILYTWVIWKSGKVILSQHVAGLNSIGKELKKTEQEMQILKSQVKDQEFIIKKNSEKYKINQINESPTQLDSNFKMFPNTQREGAYEFFVTNSQVVIVRFHGLGIESHVTVPKKIKEMPVVCLGARSFSRFFRINGQPTQDNLAKVTLPESLEKIEGGAFQMNRNLSEVQFPPKINEIEDFTFAFCGFTNLVLPNTIQKIGKSAFMANMKLSTINIPASVKSIGEKAFSGCRNLANIEILGTNTVIEADAFKYCPNQPANTPFPTNPQ